MPPPDHPPFTIVGAGLAGALLACYLGRAGHRVDLYEKRADPRDGSQDRGRSINLAISVRGIHALREVGIADEVLKSAIPMRGRMMHSRTGELSFQPYGKDDSECINSISRSGLNLALINAAAKHETVRLNFRKRCTGMDLGSGAVELVDDFTHTPGKVEGGIVIAADGAFSAVRGTMQRHERFDYHQEYLTHGYKELTMPAPPGGGFAMEKHALHIWPRHSFMMIALPNLDGSFTCTLFWPFEGPNSFAALRTEADILRFFREQFPDAVPLMPTLAEDFLANPTGSLVTIRCRPWFFKNALLIGDAAHAVVPFLGQGMNAAFEDCSVLNECLARHTPHWQAAFQDFEKRRKENTDVLAEMCVDNFIEMRDTVSSRWFLWKKKLDVLMSKLFPRWFVPLYTLISFTRTPYAEARRRSREQDRVMKLIGAGLLIVVIVVMLFWLKW